MFSKKIVYVSIAVVALCAVVAGSASGTATESNGGWLKESSTLPIGTKEPVTCAVGLKSLGLVGTFETTSFELKATGVACPGGSVYNEGLRAKGTGKLKLTGVTVSGLTAGCAVSGGAIETETLNSQVWMEGTKALVKFSPVGATVATVKLTTCGAYTGSYPVKGTVFGEMANATGVEASTQTVNFSSAINKAAGGTLTFGGKQASLEGQIGVSLTGGGEFEANEIAVRCALVVQAGTGWWNDAACTVPGGTNSYIKVAPGKLIEKGVECAVVAEAVNVGVYTDSNCTKVEAGQNREYIKVFK
jgi:hypothetical protein